MSESLQRLVDIGAFTHLQDKLQKWNSEFKTNTTDENLARACEIVELNARLQGQLFKLLGLCAAEGRLYGAGAAGIKSRLLPLLGQGFFASGLSSDASLSVIADAVSKERQATEVRQSYEDSLARLEADLKQSQAENEDIKAELESTRMELERQGRASASEKMFAEAELHDLRQRLSEEEVARSQLQSRADLVDDYDRQVRRLRDEIGDLHARRDLLYGPLAPPPPTPLPPTAASLALRGRYYSDYYGPPPPPPMPPLPHVSSRLARSIDGHLAGLHGPPPLVSPLSPADPLLRSRRQVLIARYLDLTGPVRLDAIDALQRCYDDQENNSKIVCAAVQEAFALARLAFREFKARVRAQLLLSHIGPESLDEAVQDFINCHHQPEDLQGMTEDVIRALTRDHRLYLPPGINYGVIGPFIRAACQLAWEMSALAQPMEVSRCRDGEVFDEQKYRRTCDSEFTAPLVSHFAWPALLQGAEVVAKGEACTRRGGADSTTVSLIGDPSCHRHQHHHHNHGLHRRNRFAKPASIAGSAASSSSASHCLCCCGGRGTQCCNRTVLNPRCAIPLSCLATPTSDETVEEGDNSSVAVSCRASIGGRASGHSGSSASDAKTLPSPNPTDSANPAAANPASLTVNPLNPTPGSDTSDCQLAVLWNVDLLTLKRRLMTQRVGSASRSASRTESTARNQEFGRPVKDSNGRSSAASKSTAAASASRGAAADTGRTASTSLSHYAD